LQQKYDGEWHPVLFRSRKLLPAEKNDMVHERELLAIVDFLKAHGHYLAGVPTKVFTDHQPLRYVRDQPKLTPRQQRWMQLPLHQRLDIVYKPGKENVVPDALSRMVAVTKEKSPMTISER
jgi:hypothetical protein